MGKRWKEGGRSRGNQSSAAPPPQTPSFANVFWLPGMKQNSSVFVDDSFGCFCSEQHCFVPGSDGGPLGLYPQPVGGKYGDVPRLQLQLFRRLGCLDDGLIWVELHNL